MAIQCPPIPAALADGLPPPGSAQWCAWIDDALRFMAGVAKTVQAWLDRNMSYTRWYNALAAYQQACAASDNGFLRAWSNVLKAICDLLYLLCGVLDIGIELLSCAWTMRQLVTSVAHPEAYLGCQILLNVIKSVKSMKLGSQSYTGFTIDAVVSMPALEQILTHLMDYLVPMEMPSVGEATSAWAHGLITDAQRDCIWKYWGHNPAGYEPYVLGSTQSMGVREAIEYGRRSAADQQSILQLMRRAGVVDPTQQAGILALYDRLPTEGQALEWTRRRSNDETFAARYGLDAGFADVYWPAYQESLIAQGVTEDVARQNYRQHWTALGRGELSELYYRLRPNNPDVSGLFDSPDFKAFLAASGYSPVAQDWLYQLRYRPLSIGDATDLYRRGMAAPEIVLNAYLDAGQSPAHAAALANREQFVAARWRAQQYGGWTPQAAGKAYAIGLLSDSQVSQILAPLGGSAADVAALEQRATADYQYRILQRAKARVLSLSVTQVRQALSVGVLDVPGATTALVSVGWPAAQAAGIATLESASARVALVKQSVGRVRSALLAGEITVAQAEAALHQLGIVPSSMSQYIAMWQIQNTPARKRRSASQIVTDLAEGTLAVADATGRLTNLGYGSSDIELYLQDAERKQITSAPARAAAVKLDVQIGSPVKGGLNGLSKRAVRELMAQETPTMLATYLKAGVVSAEYVMQRLELYGWEQQPIYDFIAGNGGGSGSDTVSGPTAKAPAGSAS
jgi:hypothetical protein